MKAVKRSPKIRETRFLGRDWKWYKWPTGKGKWTPFLLLKQKESDEGIKYVGLNLESLFLIVFIGIITLILILNT